jgi:uncharacterized damage-inducible protein DinB
LTHIALASRFQHLIHAVEKRTSFDGLNFGVVFQEMAAEEAKPRTKAQVIELLRTEGEKWATFLDGVSEESLAQTFTMPPGGTPPQRVRFDMILSVKEHEMHHRAQLMVMERLMGIVPHLTRQAQERMARMQAQQAQQKQGS